MSNPTTAAEWKSVAAQYEQQNQELAKQVAGYDAQLVDIDKQLAEIANKIRGLARTPGGLTGREYDAMNADLVEQRRALIRQRNPIQQDKNQTNKQISENNKAIANANSKADIAQEGEPQTETTTPPATQQPGDGATVPPATPPVQATSTPPVVTLAADPSQVTSVASTVQNTTPIPQNTEQTTTAAPIENTTPAPIQQYSNRPPQPAEEIPYTQRTVDDDPTATIQAQVEVEQQQKQIAINTAGLPVVAEDGTVAKGVNINPETGQTYYTTPPNEISQNPSATGSSRGLQGAKRRTRAQATSQDASYLSRLPDWRVKLQLAEGANYLYKVTGSNGSDAGILQPLQETQGVIFPYTPTIQVQYGAHYDATDLTHSNYKVYQYKNSSVDNISITADFTAQDTYEARYLLAVIHFFRSVTKMFYGNDLDPRNGTPPPLCYITGLGEFQFNQHPLAITNFTYTLPNDVDYIRANTEANSPIGVNQSPANIPDNTDNPSSTRTTSSGIQAGGRPLGPKFNINPSMYKTGAVDPTYVPTKMQIQITAVPMMSRNVISTKFSLKDYASGKLLRGSEQPGVKGVW
jgi:hypothetical protein